MSTRIRDIMDRLLFLKNISEEEYTLLVSLIEKESYVYPQNTSNNTWEKSDNVIPQSKL